MRKRTKVLLAVVAGGTLLALSPILWLGVCVWRSPSFEEWVRERPVEDPSAVLAVSNLAGISPAVSGLPAVFPADFDADAHERAGVWRTDVEILHGSETLLDLELEVRVCTEEIEVPDGTPPEGLPPRTERLVGVQVTERRRVLHPDLHALAFLGVGGVDREIGGGLLTLEVFLLAGPGEFRAAVVPFEGPRSQETLLCDLKRVTPLMLPGMPNEEGLAVHASLGLSLGWQRTETGSSGAGYHFPALSTNTRAYSLAVNVESEASPPWSPEGSGSMSTEVSRDFEWLGETW